MIPLVYLALLIDAPFLATMPPEGWRTIGWVAFALLTYLLYAEWDLRRRLRL